MTESDFTINGKSAEHGKLYDLIVSEGKCLPQDVHERLILLGAELCRKKSIKERLLKRFRSFMERLTPKDND